MRPRRPARAAGLLAILLALPWLAGASAPDARQEGPGDPPPQEGPPSPAAEAPEEDERPSPGRSDQPDLIADFTTRSYRIKPKRLWKALLPALEASGYPPEEVDQESMTVKTKFVDFEQKKFGEQVAEPPPRFRSDYHIITLKQVVAGKVSLEAVVSRTRGGAELRIRARILVQGLDRRQRVMVLVDRRSSGVIEADFLRKLEDDLGLKRF